MLDDRKSPNQGVRADLSLTFSLSDQLSVLCFDCVNTLGFRPVYCVLYGWVVFLGGLVVFSLFVLCFRYVYCVLHLWATVSKRRSKLCFEKKSPNLPLKEMGNFE